MKLLRIILALFCAVPAFAQKEALQRAVGTNTVTGSLSSTPFQVATIAALKATVVTNIPDGAEVSVTCYSTLGDGGEGSFKYSAASAATDNGGTIIAPNAGSGRWLRVYIGEINVRWFGAKGDSSTDDTVALQSAIDCALVSGVFATPRDALFIPAGTYKLTDELEIPFSTGWIVRGESRAATILKQYGDNKAIFRFNHTLTHSWRIHSIQGTWNTAQNNTKTNSYFMRFDQDENAGSGGEYFSWHVSDVLWSRGYRGIGFATTGTGSISMWNCKVSDFLGSSMSGASLNWRTPGAAYGIPNVTFENGYITNVGCTEPVIIGSSIGELQMYNLDIEQGTNIPVFDLRQCNTVIDGMHIENWVFTATGSENNLFYTEQSQVVGSNVMVALTTCTTQGGGVLTNVWRGYQSDIIIHSFTFATVNPMANETNFYLYGGQNNVYTILNPEATARYRAEIPSVGNIYRYPDSIDSFNVRRLIVGGPAAFSATTSILRASVEYSVSVTSGSAVITNAGLASGVKVGDEIVSRAFSGFGEDVIVNVTNIAGNDVTVSQTANMTGTVTVRQTRKISSTSKLRAMVFTDDGGAGIRQFNASQYGSFVLYRQLGSDRFGHAIGLGSADDTSGELFKLWKANFITFGEESPTDFMQIGETKVQFLSGATAKAGWFRGTGSPESVVTAPIGSFYSREDGGASTSFYVKESGAGNTGWIAK